jgi:hypothetical protein
LKLTVTSAVAASLVGAIALSVAQTREAATAEVTVSFKALMLALLARALVDVGAGPEDPVSQD